MRDLIATQNLDSFTAQLLGRCRGNWFLQIVVQQICAGFTMYAFALILQSFDLGIFMKTICILQDQQNAATLLYIL